MVTFLFWNLNKQPLEAIIRELALRHDVDVLILTECAITAENLLRVLNAKNKALYHRTDTNCKCVEILTRFAPELMRPLQEGPRWTIRRLALPARIEIIFVAAHAISKLHWSAESQSHECIRLAETIREVEDRLRNNRTVLVADLNMNPFDTGVVSAMGLNAAMTRQVAEKERRTVQGEKYPFFYNPMWGHFGDSNGGPPGTYYYEADEHVAYYWYMFDQVLLRPGLLPHFRNEDLRILATDGTRSLVRESGVPDQSIASDHLPILFGLHV